MANVRNSIVHLTYYHWFIFRLNMKVIKKSLKTSIETSIYTLFNVNVIKLEVKKEICCPYFIRNSEKVTLFSDLSMNVANNII